MSCPGLVHAKRSARAFVDSTYRSRGCSICRRPAAADRLPFVVRAAQARDGAPTVSYSKHALAARVSASTMPNATARRSGRRRQWGGFSDSGCPPSAALRSGWGQQPCGIAGDIEGRPGYRWLKWRSIRWQCVSGASSERLPAALRQRNVEPVRLTHGVWRTCAAGRGCSECPRR